VHREPERVIADDIEAAVRRLTDLLQDCGDLDGAIQILRGGADADVGDVSRLAELLARQGHGEKRSGYAGTPEPGRVDRQ
jgi:hypothetical protein